MCGGPLPGNLTREEMIDLCVEKNRIIWKMKAVLEKNLRDMDNIDAICVEVDVHPFAQMRKDIEGALKLVKEWEE